MKQQLTELIEAIEPTRVKLLQHTLYDDLTNLESLRFFMEHHVFAVWDFMSLLKAMQSHFCGTSIPWTPTSNVLVARMIHEIILEEETDSDGDGGYASHFELYLRSMRQCKADTTPIERFLELVREGVALESALKQIDAPQVVCDFVGHTFSVVNSRDPVQIVSAFTFGRENLLPGVFGQIVEKIDQQTGGEVAMLKYYLERHIGLDGDVHGPLAERLVCQLCGDDSAKWERAQRAALEALEHRLKLWDGMTLTLASRSRLNSPVGTT
ncbi:MAG: DUF3050 domain-containing protein [Pirellula sp.]|jgi:hypothetical protein|nr:DUF3050 domain-containing protein [Pirellula sp.]